jgi:Uma2 family endonuclease
MVSLPFNPIRPWRIDDLASMPDDGRRYELLQGEIIASPTPGRTHQRIFGYLLVRLAEAETRAKCGEVIQAPMDVHFSPNDLVIPDIFYIRDQQAAQYRETHFDGAPAFIIEIVSPTSGFYDRVRKTALYMMYGVEEYWIVDPEKRCILVYHSTGHGLRPQIVESGMLTSTVLTTFSIDAVEVFAAADQPRM